jgi:hypothetical protein
MVVTFGLLGSAFYLTYRHRAAKRTAIMALNKAMLWGVTFFVALLLFYPQLFTQFASADGGFTSDMTRTVVKIEGMTCPG